MKKWKTVNHYKYYTTGQSQEKPLSLEELLTQYTNTGWVLQQVIPRQHTDTLLFFREEEEKERRNRCVAYDEVCNGDKP